MKNLLQYYCSENFVMIFGIVHIFLSPSIEQFIHYTTVWLQVYAMCVYVTVRSMRAQRIFVNETEFIEYNITRFFFLHIYLEY